MIGKKLLMIGGKAGFQPEKAGKVMTADHHDRELCMGTLFEALILGNLSKRRFCQHRRQIAEGGLD